MTVSRRLKCPIAGEDASEDPSKGTGELVYDGSSDLVVIGGALDEHDDTVVPSPPQPEARKGYSHLAMCTCEDMMSGEWGEGSRAWWSSVMCADQRSHTRLTWCGQGLAPEGLAASLLAHRAHIVLSDSDSEDEVWM